MRRWKALKQDFPLTKYPFRSGFVKHPCCCVPRPAPTFGEGKIRPTPNPRTLATYNQHQTAAIREIPIASFEAIKAIARLNFRCLFILARSAGLFSQTAAGNRAYSHWQSTHNTLWATPHDPWGCNEGNWCACQCGCHALSSSSTCCISNLIFQLIGLID